MNLNDVLVVWQESANDDDKNTNFKIKKLEVLKDYPDMKYVAITLETPITKKYWIDSVGSISTIGIPFIKLYRKNNYKHIANIFLKNVKRMENVYRCWEFFNVCAEYDNMITFVAMRELDKESLLEMLNDKIEEER